MIITSKEQNLVLCACGCGEEMLPTDRRGRPRRFIKGHESRGSRGGTRLMSSGYERSLKGDDPKSPRAGKALRHTLLAEKALGKPLPAGAEIHHVNNKRADNSPGNLVICQDRSYHRLLHQRTLALKASGQANWLKCKYCGTYDDPKNMTVNAQKHRGYHRSCAAEYQQNRYAKNLNGGAENDLYI